MQEEESKPKCNVLLMLRHLEKFSDEKMCGKCYPCRIGTEDAIRILRRMVGGAGEEGDVDKLKAIASVMKAASFCKLGRDAGGALADSISEHRIEYEQHISEKLCVQRECDGLITYRIVPYRCTMCGACKKVCEFDAIIGEEFLPYSTENLPYRIIPRRCRNCGICVSACPENAIEVVQRELITQK